MSSLSAEEHKAIEELASRVEAGDYYAILGVDTECNQADLKKAYYDLSRRFHPDRFYRRDVGDTLEQIEEVFTGINISFEVLSDDVKRRRFDLERSKNSVGSTLSERRDKRTAPRSTRPEPRADRPAPPTPVEEATSPQDTGTGQEAEGEKSQQGVVGETSPRPENEAPLDTDQVTKEDRARVEAPTQSRRLSTYARHRQRLRRSRDSQRAGGERPEKSAEASGDASPDRSARTSAGNNSRVTQAVRNRLSARMEKAKACYQDGLKEIEAENWVKAASSLYMAHQYNPKNEEYKRLWEETQVKSNRSRAAQFIALAENAESFRNVREAMENYKRATECDPEDGVAHYRFGQLLNEFSGDARGALQQFRHAVQKEPRNVRYRIALADLYIGQGMTRNAIREYQKVLEIEPKHKEAKLALRKLRF